MKKFLIPITAIICASISILCTACQAGNSEGKETTAPTIAVSATADETTTDGATTATTLPVISESHSTEPTTENMVESEPVHTESNTVETYPNGMPIVAESDEITRFG